jgi:hypothetical protein
MQRHEKKIPTTYLPASAAGVWVYGFAFELNGDGLGLHEMI